MSRHSKVRATKTSRPLNEWNEWKCSDLKSIRKPTRSRLSLTHWPLCTRLTNFNTVWQCTAILIIFIHHNHGSSKTNKKCNWNINKCFIVIHLFGSAHVSGGGGVRPTSGRSSELRRYVDRIVPNLVRTWFVLYSDK